MLYTYMYRTRQERKEDSPAEACSIIILIITTIKSLVALPPILIDK